MGREMATSSGLNYGALGTIAERLSAIPELYLPHSFRGDRAEVSPQEIKDHLLELVQRDPAIFLERYGRSLYIFELKEFDPLGGDYEVDWHLRQLRETLNPSIEQQKSRVAIVKNRRLAFMEKLVEDGQYFTEEAMRMRCPLLHHQYLGQFQDPNTWSNFQRRGDKLVDVIIRQSDEAAVQKKLEEEREREEQQEEEEEEDDDDDEGEELPELNSFSCMQLSDEQQKKPEENKVGDEEKKKKSVDFQEEMSRPARKLAGNRDERLEQFTTEMMAKFLAQDEPGSSSSGSNSGSNQAEMESRLEDFTRVMQEKFLSGEDGEHFDYSRIDGDAALDDHWLQEVACDAEDKYFDD